MDWDIVTVTVFVLIFQAAGTAGLQCYSCVKVSPPALCAKSCDRTHPPCKSPFIRSHKLNCDSDESCVAITQVHVGKVLNLFGCYNCQEMLQQVPGIKCVECNEDLCNDKAPTSCDMGFAESFTIVKAGKDDRQEIVRLMTDVFFKTDPSSVYTRVAETPNLSSELQEITVDCLDEGMSFVAKEKEKDMYTVGAALNGIRPTTLSPTYMESTLKKVKAQSERALLELWTHVSLMPPDSQKFFQGEKQLFEVQYLVVDPSRRNRGIATALVKSSIKEAARKGYKFIRIDCTSHFTARIASAVGLNLIYEMKYQDYKNLKGEQVFQNVQPPHTKILVYAGKSS